MPRSSSLWHPCSRRLHVLLLCMLGVFCSTFLNTNLAISMTCMVNSTAVAYLEGHDVTGDEDGNETVITDGDCGASTNSSNVRSQPIVDYGGSLIWDHNIQNLLFSAHMWGSLLGIPISLFFMQKLSPKWTFAFVLALKAAMNIIIPVSAIYLSFHAVFAARFMLGVGEQFIYPCINTILAAFFRMEERSTALALFTSGNQLAMVFGNQIGAAFCKSRFGWPGAFYFPSLITFGWMALWSAFASNAPQECKKMSVAERAMYNSPSMMKVSNRKNQKVPWLQILTNLPFLSHLLCNVSITIIATLLMIYLPSYFKDVLRLGVLANGAYSSLPTIFNFTFKLTWSLFVDKMKRAGKLTPTQAVRISQLFPSFGIFISLICLVLFASCSTPQYAFIIFCFTNLCLGAHTSGGYTSLLSLAPSLTPTLSSISVGIGALSQLFTPLLILVLNPTSNAEGWDRVFIAMAVIAFASGVAFTAFGSGEIQKFAPEYQEKGTSEGEQFLDVVKVNSLRAESISIL